MNATELKGSCQTKAHETMVAHHLSDWRDTTTVFIQSIEQGGCCRNHRGAGVPRRVSRRLHHMSGELFRIKAGIDIVHVPYKGTGPALIDLLAGQVNMMVSSLPSAMGYIRNGRLRPLAVTGRDRI